MKKVITHAICVILGLIVGYALQSSSFAPVPSAKRPDPKFTSVEDALMWLREAAKYIEESLKPTRYDAVSSAKSKQPERYVPSPELNEQ